MFAIDFLILADFAEVVGGKLYLQGGGWDRLTAGGGFPVVRNVGVAVGINVPWEETNRRYTMSVQVINDDSQAVLLSAEGQLETGRPPGIVVGQEQLVVMALQGVLTFQAPGEFRVVASINGEEQRRKAFRVIEAAGATRPNRPRT